jgi:hypothetical protein
VKYASYDRPSAAFPEKHPNVFSVPATMHFCFKISQKKYSSALWRFIALSGALKAMSH